VRPSAGSTPPHNQRIEPTAGGWHGPRGRSLESLPWASPVPVPSSPSASQAGFRPSSRLIRALYGQGVGPHLKSGSGTKPRLISFNMGTTK
jgi:hypothetical protein